MMRWKLNLSFCFAVLVAVAMLPAGTNQAAQTRVITCVDAAPGAKHAKHGCFNLARAGGLTFAEGQEVFWSLFMFSNEAVAQSAKSTGGVVVKEYGRVWLSEFGSKDLAPAGGRLMARVGPLHVEPGVNYDQVFSYVITQPGDRTPVQTHSGPETWYLLAGQQCVETPDGVARAQPGDAVTLQLDVPMQVVTTGKSDRHAFAVVLHDSGEHRSKPSDWTPTGACER